jgi:hypothetical protein
MYQEYKWVITNYTDNKLRFFNGIDFSQEIRYAKRYASRMNALKAIQKYSLRYEYTDIGTFYATCREPYQAVHICKECLDGEHPNIVADYLVTIRIWESNMQYKKYVCEEHIDMVCTDYDVIKQVDLNQH